MSTETSLTTVTKCSLCIRGPSACHLWLSCSSSNFISFRAISSEMRQQDSQQVQQIKQVQPKSDGSTASYYVLPPDAKELQDIISFLNCNAQLGEIGRAWYRYGRCPHSERARDLKKIIFYAQAELERLEKHEK